MQNNNSDIQWWNCQLQQVVQSYSLYLLANTIMLMSVVIYLVTLTALLAPQQRVTPCWHQSVYCYITVFIYWRFRIKTKTGKQRKKHSVYEEYIYCQYLHPAACSRSPSTICAHIHVHMHLHICMHKTWITITIIKRKNKEQIVRQCGPVYANVTQISSTVMISAWCRSTKHKTWQ